jgi:stage II sporulation protein P
MPLLFFSRRRIMGQGADHVRKSYRRGKREPVFSKEKLVQACGVSIAFMLLFFLCANKLDPAMFLLHETLPGFPLSVEGEDNSKGAAASAAQGEEPLSEAAEVEPTPDPVYSEPQGDGEESAPAMRVEDLDISASDLLGTNDIAIQPETDPNMEIKQKSDFATIADIEKLKSLDYLRQNFYTVDKSTLMTEEDFNVDAFLATDSKIDNTIEGPKILIFHTHSNEMFADSDTSDVMEGVVGVGEKLARILTDEYGIETMHHIGRYDIVDGRHMIQGAYERIVPEIEKILAANPSIQVCIDLHRDGVLNENTKFVTTENGIKMAQVMFFNGICKKLANGVLQPVSGLKNPYVQDNLALSFKAQLLANDLFPDFTRRVYIQAYRYSLHMLPKSMLIEVGAQTNTKEEAMNTAGPLARILSQVLN